MEKKKLVLYTKTPCPKCKMTKRYLDEHGVEYEMVDVFSEEGLIDKIKQHTGERTEMPVLSINDFEDFITGFNPPLLKKLT